MSVTIVSTQPKQTQATTANTGATLTDNENAVTGQDFASLLLGQHASIVPGILPENIAQGDLPATDHDSTDTAQADAASLLAALGLAPTPPGRNTDDTAQNENLSLAEVSTPGKAVSDSSTTRQTAINVGQDLKQEGKTNDIKATPEFTEFSAADDMPAKIAVTPLIPTGVENTLSKTLPVDTALNNTAAILSNILPSSNHIAPHREVSLSVPTSIRDQSWAGDFAQKIVWLATNDKQSAQLTLNPPQMGPIEISLNLDKNSATASFVSPNAETRDAIETALPRLREMFASAGIELGQTNVSAESFRQQAGNGDENHGTSQRADNAILVTEATRSSSVKAFTAQGGSGLVDLFA